MKSRRHVACLSDLKYVLLYSCDHVKPEALGSIPAVGAVG